ncbi:hypothetical protein CALCODRAFT_513383 [Calocera cornea HHB12733]|uniref:Uncharacterized protein n=1 Tax=Calocera cornea HHB12733 TaxID=1353952 RepID=A0A165C5Y8_9BASI|nr:hypothetical protein CALCODRAFT_513383 [Calocera cornea HHB12733]
MTARPPPVEAALQTASTIRAQAEDQDRHRHLLARRAEPLQEHTLSRGSVRGDACDAMASGNSTLVGDGWCYDTAMPYTGHRCDPDTIGAPHSYDRVLNPVCTLGPPVNTMPGLGAEFSHLGMEMGPSTADAGMELPWLSMGSSPRVAGGPTAANTFDLHVGGNGGIWDATLPQSAVQTERLEPCPSFEEIFQGVELEDDTFWLQLQESGFSLPS